MKRQLDLGFGGTCRIERGYEYYAVDIVPFPQFPSSKVADLSLWPIPFDDDMFDLVTAYDFVEHIPMVLYVPELRFNDPQMAERTGKSRQEKGQLVSGVHLVRRLSMVELFNEIYRVLKDGGEFYMQTPVYPHQAVWQDPTHVSAWTTETVNYFSGNYYGFHDHYGHRSRFEKVSVEVQGMHMHARLKAIKSLPEEAPYELRY